MKRLLTVAARGLRAPAHAGLVIMPGSEAGLPSQVSVSIVSHGQMALVAPLLRALQEWASETVGEVILTLNLPEPLLFQEQDFGFPVRILRNAQPLGFGANHNQASRQARRAFFCVLNPDIRLQGNPFAVLTDVLATHPEIAVVAPRVKDSEGRVEDNARYFPTAGEIARKLIGGRSRTFDQGTDAIGYPDWVAGMFMLSRLDTFRALGGFDERYHLYYEDVDLCARAAHAGYRVGVVDIAGVVHDAQRTSHRKLKYAGWHLKSMCRYFLSKAGRGVCVWAVRQCVITAGAADTKRKGAALCLRRVRRLPAVSPPSDESAYISRPAKTDCT